jgi:hypothetical protein
MLDVLRSANAPLTPKQIVDALGGSVEGRAVDEKSVRSAVRNVRRIEKGATERGEIDGPVLIGDATNYGVDGAYRYSLAR